MSETLKENKTNQTARNEEIGSQAVCYTTKIEYDDGFLEILDKINELLKKKKLVFILDGEVHDGFEVIELKQVA